MVLTHHWMKKSHRRDRSSTVYETDYTREKADEKSKMEYEKWMEESSRSVEQRAEKSAWKAYSAKECLASQE